MTTPSRAHPLFASFRKVTLATATVLASASGLTFVYGQEIIKADNATILSDPASWVGGVVPGSGDVAVWNNTITTNRSANIGANLTWAGIAIRDIPAGSLMTIGNTAGAVLSLGASGIDMSTAAGNLTVSGVLNFAADQTWSLGSGTRLSLGNGANSGSANITITGPGTFVLTQTGSNLGATSLTLGGNLNLTPTAASAVTISQSVRLAGDVIYRANPVAPTQTLTLNGNVDVGNATRTITLVNEGGSTASPTLTLTGTGTQFSGAGALAIANGNSGGSPAALAIRLGTGGGSSAQIRTGLTIGNNLTLYVSSGSVMTSDTRLTLEAGSTYTTSSTPSSGSSISQTVGSLAGAGTVTNSGNASTGATLTIDGTSNTTRSSFSGNITDGSTARVAITKNGSTTQAFGGTNRYSGQTQINGGVLLINGTHASSSIVLTGANGGWASATNGNFRVASGATLGGNGRISGTNSEANSNLVLVQSGGILSPGDGIGTLTLDGGAITGTNSRILNLASGATITLDLAGNGGISDSIDLWSFINGDLVLNGNVVNLNLSGPMTMGTYTVEVIRFYSDSGTTRTASGISTGLTLSGAIIAPDIENASILYGTDAISIQYSVIPEPGVVALLGLGAFLILWRLRRRLA